MNETVALRGKCRSQETVEKGSFTELKVEATFSVPLSGFTNCRRFGQLRFSVNGLSDL